MDRCRHSACMIYIYIKVVIWWYVDISGERHVMIDIDLAIDKDILHG